MHRSLLLSTTGIVFLGSPLQGSEAATFAQWQTMLGGILNRSPSKTLLQDLDGHTKSLRETTRRFVEIIRKRPMRMETMCFWETLPTQTLNAILPRLLTVFFGFSKTIVRIFDPQCKSSIKLMGGDADR